MTLEAIIVILLPKASMIIPPNKVITIFNNAKIKFDIVGLWLFIENILVEKNTIELMLVNC